LAVTVLGIAGSLRQGSFNKRALAAACELAPEGMAIRPFQRLGDIPLYDEDVKAKGFPPPVAEFRHAIAEADALLFVTPEYNYSVPGVLKNAIDWASRPYGDSAWDGKPAAIMGASIGAIGTARMQYHLRQMMVFLNMYPVNRPEVMITNCTDKYDDKGNLTDEETKKFISQLVQSLADWTRKLKGA